MYIWRKPMEIYIYIYIYIYIFFTSTNDHKKVVAKFSKVWHEIK